VLAAEYLMGEGGLEGLTIRAVLKRTGLARRAFYESFAGKDDLVLAVFERVLSGAAEHFARSIGEIDDPAERLRIIVFGIILGPYALSDEPPAERRSAALSREHLRLAEARPGELAAALRPLLALITEQIDRGIRKGAFREADPALQATLVYNLVSTTTHTELLKEDGAPDRDGREALAGYIWDFCRRAITS